MQPNEEKQKIIVGLANKMDLNTCMCLFMTFLIQSTIANSSLDSGINVNVCLTKECNQTAAEILSRMDSSVSPCDNFYKFVCGKYVDDGSSSGPERFQSMIQYCLDETASEKRNEPYKKAFKLYDLYKDENMTGKPGVAYLREIINKIGGWPLVEGKQWKEKKWESVVSELSKLDYQTSVFFRLDIWMLVTNRSLITIFPPGFQLSNTINSYQLSNFPAHLNANSSLSMMDYMMMFESLRINFERLRFKSMDEDTYESLSLAAISLKWPSIDWMTYLKGYFTKQSINFDQNLRVYVNVNYTNEIVKFIENHSNSDIVNFIITKFVGKFFQYLQLEITEKHNSNDIKAQDKFCVKLVTNELPSLIYAIIHVNYFNNQLYDEFNGLVNSLKNKMGELLEQANWLDLKTSQFYINRLSNLTHRTWESDTMDIAKYIKEYDDLELDERSFFHSMWSIIRFKQNELMKRINVKDESHSDYFPIELIMRIRDQINTVNGHYQLQKNELVILPGAFLKPRFKNNVPKYINYGALGHIIAHELGHAFPSWEILKFYRYNKPLSKDTNQNLLDRIQCFIDQYNNYTVEEINMKINGTRTIGENLADNIATKLTHLIYKDWLSHNQSEPGLPNLNFTTMQMFWISQVTYGCIEMNSESLIEALKKDLHSPKEFRTIGAFSNYPEFSEAFNCSLGSRMNPLNKCTLW